MWTALQHITDGMDLPWLLLGDFNSPLSPADKQGGIDVTTYATSDFRDFVMTAGVEDLHSIVCQFTWTNGRIVCKLDRAMVNKTWLEQDRSSFADFKAPGGTLRSCLLYCIHLRGSPTERQAIQIL